MSRSAIPLLLLLVSLVLLVLPVIPAGAKDAVVIYRCTDASGALTVQNNVPCPKGSRQERRVMETARPSAPPPVSTPPAATLAPLVVTPDAEDVARLAATAAASPEAQTPPPDREAGAVVERLPPPPLFACRTWDRKEYFSDDAEPIRRCAPLRVSGLDGSAGGGGATACEKITDTCAPVPGATLCEKWQQHAHDTRAMLLFGRAEDPAATRAELTRIDTLIEASSCAGG